MKNIRYIFHQLPLAAIISIIIQINCFAQEYHAECLPPVYDGGIEALHEYIKANLHYPERAKANKITGVVMVDFTVSTDGAIKDTRVISGFDDECNSEAVRLVNSMNKWKQAVNWGMPLDTELQIPIEFKIENLNDDKENVTFLGTVIERCTGKPLERVLVRILDTNIGGLTNNNGEFEFSIPKGKYDLEVSSAGYETRLINVKNYKVLQIDLDKKTYLIDFDSAIIK
jgi:TonB family protein